eukprot:COSAG01_NODE_8938_length_2608_cov_6.614333_1_plen_85_part_00
MVRRDGVAQPSDGAPPAVDRDGHRAGCAALVRVRDAAQRLDHPPPNDAERRVRRLDDGGGGGGGQAANSRACGNAGGVVSGRPA